MFRLVALLISKAQAVLLSRQVQIGTGIAVIADLINLDVLRQWALEVAPGSDGAAIEEAARMAARALGLEGDEVLWPVRRDGMRITPKYMVIDLNRGRAWYSTHYYSKKSVSAGRRRGFGRGMGAGRRQAVDNKIIAG